MLSTSVIRFIEKNRQWKVYVHDENITEEDGETLTVIQFAEKRILSSRGQGFPKGNGDMNYQRGGELNLKWSVNSMNCLEYTQEFKEANKQMAASNRLNKQSLSQIDDLNLVNQTKRHAIAIIHYEKQIKWVPWNSERVNNTLGNGIEP